MNKKSETGTSEKLLMAAEPLFAAKGFYGVSIREVAEHLDIAKSSLLYHFSTKEKLYAELLKKIAGELTEEVRQIKSGTHEERLQLKLIVGMLCKNSRENRQRNMIIMRELLDNPERAETARQWFFSEFLYELTDIIRSGQHKGVFQPVNPELFILHLLGAHRYLAISLPTFKRVFDAETYNRLLEEHESEMAQYIEARLHATSSKNKKDINY